jgi:hypothetical protein
MNKKLSTVALALVALSACVSQSGSPEDVTISISSPLDGDTVAAGEPVTVEINVEGTDLDVVTSEGAGHLHVTVDGEGMQMISQETTQVTLTKGEHEIKAEYTDENHASFDPPIEDTVEVTAE